MVTTESRRGRVALMVAHCAGMVDLVALPVWVGTLIGHYRFDPQQAGGLATLFLAAVVVASGMLAPRFGRLPRRAVAVAGFGAAGLAFLAASMRQDFTALAMLHALAGLATGAALSVTHGTIARSANPHRLFAVAGIALGVFSIAFFATVPPLLAALGGSALFRVFAAVMAVAAVVAWWIFPQADSPPAGTSAPSPTSAPPMPRAVWFGVVGIASMALVQAMTFAFVERIGIDRGFGAAAVGAMLIALSLVNLFPAALAALLERRLSARAVLLTAPMLHALLAMVITQSGVFLPYAMAASVFVAVTIFAHTFAFGLLARLDASGRVLAATPAMLMTGAAIGPVLGGTLVKAYGYGALAIAAALIGAGAVACFSRLPGPAAATPRSAPA